MWRTIVQWAALPLCTFCVGFGSSEFIAVQDVRRQVMTVESTTSKSMAVFEQRMNRQDDAMKDLREADNNNRADFSSRMTGMATLVEKSMETANKVLEMDREVVGLFKVQQQLIK